MSAFHYHYPTILKRFPGCGKTLLANCIAGEIGLPMFSVSGPEIVSGVSGESEQNIRNLFQSAKAQAPCLLFLDEVDVIAGVSTRTEERTDGRMMTDIWTDGRSRTDGRTRIHEREKLEILTKAYSRTKRETWTKRKTWTKRETRTKPETDRRTDGRTKPLAFGLFKNFYDKKKIHPSSFPPLRIGNRLPRTWNGESWPNCCHAWTN